MDTQFGSMRAQSVARDHVFGALGGRTALQAIEAGLPVRKVWLAICEEDEGPARGRCRRRRDPTACPPGDRTHVRPSLASTGRTVLHRSAGVPEMSDPR